MDYLKTARNTHTAAFGAMTEVVGNSTPYLSGQDLLAITIYLKSLDKSRGAVVAASPAAATLVLLQGSITQCSARVYLHNCNARHRWDGQGAQRVFATLAPSSSVAATEPTSRIRILLQSSTMAHTKEAPSRQSMPGFGWLTQANEHLAMLFASAWRTRQKAC